MKDKISFSSKKVKVFFMRIAKLVILIYALFVLLLYFGQTKLLYFPNNQNFETCQNFENYQKGTFQNTRFYFLEKSKSVTVFYHGNAGSTCDRAFLKPLLEQGEQSIIFVEYAGYSADKQNTNKKLLLEDVQNIKDFIEQKDFNKVTVIGESIGTGMASYHTSLAQVENLLLISPFSKIADVAQSKYTYFPIKFLLKENYDNVAYLKNYSKNLLIIHGTEDQIIPINFGIQLYESVHNAEKKFIKIKNAGHNNLYDFNKVILEIINFIK